MSKHTYNAELKLGERFLRNHEDLLLALSRKLAVSDEVWKYMEENSSENASRYLKSSIMRDDIYDFLVLLRNDNGISASAFRDESSPEYSGAITELLQKKLARSSESSPLQKSLHHESFMEGVVLLGETPVLVAIQEVLPHSFQGAPQGYLVLGQYMGAEMIEALKRSSGLDLSFSVIPQAQRSRLAINEIASQKDISLSESGDTLTGHRVITGIDGRPALLMDLQAGRSLYKQQRHLLLSSQIWVLAMGLILGIVVITLLQRHVTDRLEEFSRTVDEIAVSEDLSHRINVEGNDELSAFGHLMNSMLAKEKAPYPVRFSGGLVS